MVPWILRVCHTLHGNCPIATEERPGQKGGDRRHHSFPIRGLWLWGVALPPSVRPKPIPPPPTPVSEPSPVKTEGGKEGELYRTSEAGEIGGCRRRAVAGGGEVCRQLTKDVHYCSLLFFFNY